jgi:hypothetical protein
MAKTLASKTSAHRNSADILELAKAAGVKIVDLRFVDLPGVWQHFSIPVDDLDLDLFEEGIGFDGSSIRGFQVIHESDMLLVADPETARVDPMLEIPTFSLICNVVDPITRKREKELAPVNLRPVPYEFSCTLIYKNFCLKETAVVSPKRRRRAQTKCGRAADLPVRSKTPLVRPAIHTPSTNPEEGPRRASATPSPARVRVILPGSSVFRSGARQPSQSGNGMAACGSRLLPLLRATRSRFLPRGPAGAASSSENKSRRADLRQALFLCGSEHCCKR